MLKTAGNWWNHFFVGSSVFLSIRRITLSIPGPTKLWPKFIGPFKVLARIGEVAHRLELPVHLKIHNVFHVSLLRRFVPGKSSIPPAVPAEANVEYEIKKLLDFQVLKVGRGTRREFLVKWLDYGPEHNTWELAIVFEKSAPDGNCQDCQECENVLDTLLWSMRTLPLKGGRV